MSFVKIVQGEGRLEFGELTAEEREHAIDREICKQVHGMHLGLVEKMRELIERRMNDELVIVIVYDSDGHGAHLAERGILRDAETGQSFGESVFLCGVAERDVIYCEARELLDDSAARMLASVQEQGRIPVVVIYKTVAVIDFA